MAEILHHVATRHYGRADHLEREQEWTLADGRTVRLETYRNGGTRTLAYIRAKVPAPWRRITTTEARRILKEQQP